MRAISMILGIGLMILGVAALIFVMAPIGRDNPTVIGIFSTVFCKPGETYIELEGVGGSQITFSRNRRLVSMYCESNEGQRREVTANVALAAVAVFVVPFVIGLVSMILSFRAIFKRTMRRAFQPAAMFQATKFASGPVEQPGQRSSNYTYTTVSVDGKPVKDVPPEAAKVIQQLFGGVQNMAGNMPQMGSVDLKDRLRQLQEARDAGLITQEEFDRIRGQILDKIDD